MVEQPTRRFEAACSRQNTVSAPGCSEMQTMLLQSHSAWNPAKDLSAAAMMKKLGVGKEINAYCRAFEGKLLGCISGTGHRRSGQKPWVACIRAGLGWQECRAGQTRKRVTEPTPGLRTAGHARAPSEAFRPGLEELQPKRRTDPSARRNRSALQRHFQRDRRIE
jgi:hypothetical protein